MQFVTFLASILINFLTEKMKETNLKKIYFNF